MSNRRQAWPGTAAKTKVDAAKRRQLARTRPKRRRARKAAPKSSAPPQAQTNSQASKGENQTGHCSTAWRDKARALARVQLGAQPRIVNVAAEIAGFNPPMPKTRDKQARGNRNGLQPVLPQKIGRGFKAIALKR